MNPLEGTSVDLDRSQTLNVSLNMISLGKKSGQTLGTVLPVALCPSVGLRLVIPVIKPRCMMQREMKRQTQRLLQEGGGGQMDKVVSVGSD